MLGVKFVLGLLALGATASPFSTHHHENSNSDLDFKQLKMSEPKHSFNLVIEDCYWDGEAPFCDGGCPPGTYEKYRDDCGDGKCCVTGSKAYCCKTSSLEGLLQKLI